MYVCICHALTEDDVKNARDEGMTNEKQVFCKFGVQAQCGRCIPDMKELLCAKSCARVSDERLSASSWSSIR